MVLHSSLEQNTNNMRNIRLLIAYDGTNFHGWQIQPNAPTIQGEIEKCLSTINNCHTTLHGAGRTDAGVHALGMVAHFNTHTSISCIAFINSLNSMLPPSIRILEAVEESLSFHSRFAAKGKTYYYTIFNGEIQMPQQRLYTLHIKAELDFPSMNKCLNIILGTHDFRCFETAGSRDLTITNGKGSIRTITNATINSPKPLHHTLSFTGDGFLRHMVRNIVGTIIEVGLNKRSVENFKDTLLSKNRSKSGTTAPAHGLTLKNVYY